MRVGYLAAALVAAVTVAANMAAAPASAVTAINDKAFLETYGVNADTLAPGWHLEGERVVWPAKAALVLKGHGLELCLPAEEMCLYETDNYNNGPADGNKKVLMVDVNDGEGSRVDFATYGFDNIMSSWYNPSAHNARWWYGFNNTGTSRCMSGRSGKNPKVGLTDNDQASSLTVYPSLSTCGDPS